MRMVRLTVLVVLLLSVLAAVVVAAAAWARNPLRVLGTSSAPVMKRNLTLSFDAKPAYSEWWSIQPGYPCVNGSVDRAAPTKPSSEAFVRDDSPGNARHGRYSARVVLNTGDHASYTCKAEAVAALKQLGEGEGRQSWWGWSWKLPTGWRGTTSWGTLFEIRANHVLWPSYGMLAFDAGARKSLRLGLHTGLTPGPGSSLYDAAYQRSVTLLGPSARRPMVYGRWLDFYMHVVWRSRRSGVLQIWYRVQGQTKFTLLYSDVPGDRALIKVRPHQTLLYNAANGSPGEKGRPGLVLEGGFYRGNADWTNTYWWDGMRRRRSRAAILRSFRSP